jgi:hypothetical protein
MKGMAAVALVTAIGVGATLGLVGSPFGSGNGGTAAGCGENDSCAALSYEATASTGSGFTCNAALASCIDLGPGTANFIGTDGSGRIRLGDDTHSPEVWIGEGGTKFGNGTAQFQNGAVLFNGTTYLQNSSDAVILDDVDGLRIVAQASTPSCSSGNKGTLSTLTSSGRAYYCDGTTAQRTGFTLSATASLNYPSLNPDEDSDLTVTVTGAVSGDHVTCEATEPLPQDATHHLFIWQSYVSSANTVTVSGFCEGSAGAFDPPAFNVICVVTR